MNVTLKDLVSELRTLVDKLREHAHEIRVQKSHQDLQKLTEKMEALPQAQHECPPVSQREKDNCYKNEWCEQQRSCKKCWANYKGEQG